MNRRSILLGIAVALIICAEVQAEERPIVGVYEVEGTSMTFYNSTGPCKAPAKHVIHIAKDGDKTDGCWTPSVNRPALNAVFFDTDMATIDISMLKPPNKT